jgi:predicted Zn-ribbon and HTH transcriptional regulator
MTPPAEDENRPRSSSKSKIGPLNRDHLQSLVEKLLQDAEIETVENYGEPTAAAPLSLGVAVTVTPAGKGPDNAPLYAVFVCTEAHQPVTLLRDDNIRTLSRTWPIVHYEGLTQRLFILDPNTLEHTVKKEVARQVSLFVNDYLAANQKTISREKKSAGIPEHFARQTIWLKCRNPACEADCEFNKRQYYRFMEKYRIEHPGSLQVPALLCKKCGEQSAYEAAKCPKCGLVFEKGWKQGDFEDRCPKCRHSKIEADRAEADRRSKSRK